MDGATTEYCSNCKRDIPSVNYVMHVNHCKRNITLCKHCQEPVPTSQLEEHFDENHVKVKCECGESLEKMDLEEHKEKSCARRSITCEFCELSLPSGEMQSHKEYCANRTDLCEKCNKYVKFKDLEEHSSINCELVKPEAPKNSGENDRSSASLSMLRAMGLTDHEDQEVYGESFQFTPELLKVFQRGYGTPPIPDPDVDSRYAPDLPSFHNLLPRGARQSRSIKYESRRFKDSGGPLENDNPLYLQNNEKAATMKSSAAENEPGPRERDHKPNVYESEEDSDFMTESFLEDQGEASWYSSLQSRRPRAIQSRVQEEAMTASLDETHLPCEFCDGMFPASDLILHQSGCQLLSLQYPSSSHPPKSDNSKSQSEHPTKIQVNRPSSSTDEEENENYYKEEEPDSAKPNLDPDMSDEEPFLPCEFCQVLLPIHALFHHQATCDIRPPSALPGSDPPDSNSTRRHVQTRPRPSRPSRPVHTRVLGSDSSDEDNRNAKDTFNKTSTGSTYSRKRIYKDGALRNGADYARSSEQTSSTNTTMNERPPRKALQGSTSNDWSSSSNDMSHKNRTKNNELFRQGSHPEPETNSKVGRELAPPSEGQAQLVKPKKMPSTTSTQKPQQKIGKTKEYTSMTSELGPTPSMRTGGNKAQGYGNEVTVAARKKPGGKASAKSDSTSVWTQPERVSTKSLEAASPPRQKRGNPRRTGVKTFDLNATFSPPGGSGRSETRDRSPKTQRKQSRKKIA